MTVLAESSLKEPIPTIVRISGLSMGLKCRRINPLSLKYFHPFPVNGILKKEYYTPDDQDAMYGARWFKEMDGRGLLSTCFNPPLTDGEREIGRVDFGRLLIRIFHVTYFC